MQSETKTFRIKLLSPLHIGCGEVYEPTSFVVKEQEKKLVSFNPFTFLGQLSEEKRREFSAICKKGTAESLVEIYRFINREAQQVRGLSVDVASEFLQHYQSVLKLTGNNIGRNLNQFTINRTAFSPVKGQPYIPGSAIKGSLRTAVLEGRFQKNSRALPPRGNPRQRNNELQTKLLGGGFEHDPFCKIKVSDFHPISEVRRTVCYAVDVKKKLSKREAGAVYQIVEVVEPGTLFQGSITVASPGRIKNPVDFAEIEKALTGFFGREKVREDLEIAIIGANPGESPQQGSLPLRIGRHSGAECVTSVDDKREIKIMMGRGNQPKTLNHATTIWFTSPSKKPDNKKALRPFGWASLMEVDEKAERAQRLRAEEDEKFPWKPMLRILAATPESNWDWGRLKTLLTGPLAEWKQQAEVAAAINSVAAHTHKNSPRKWGAERDAEVVDWLAETASPWTSRIVQEVEEELSAEILQIRAFTDLGTFKNSSLSMAELPPAALQELKKQFKAWGCDNKKAKKEKQKLWKEVNSLIREAQPK